MSTRALVSGLLVLALSMTGCTGTGLRAHYMGKQYAPTIEALVTDTIGRDFTPSPTAELLGDSYVVNNMVRTVGLRDFATSIGANLVIVESEQIGTEAGVGGASTYQAPQYVSGTATSIEYTKRGPVTRTANASGYTSGSSSYSTYSMNKPVWRHKIKFYRDPSLPGIRP